MALASKTIARLPPPQTRHPPRSVTNIVFTNGGLDPWSAFGVLETEAAWDASIVSILIPDGGHHGGWAARPSECGARG
jgi:hypothetical protein